MNKPFAPSIACDSKANALRGGLRLVTNDDVKLINRYYTKSGFLQNFGGSYQGIYKKVPISTSRGGCGQAVRQGITWDTTSTRSTFYGREVCLIFYRTAY